jgi:CRISPR-associated protein Cmr5
MGNTNRQFLSQGRANAAFERVKEFVDANRDKNGNVLDEYKSYSKKVPMMIKTNGLGPALAFIKAKAKNDGSAYGRIYMDLTHCFISSAIPIISLTDKDDLLEKVLQLDDAGVYRAATNEILAFMNWHRRFTEAMINK